MKSITILKRDATIVHDGIVAQTPEGRPVFIVSANLPAPQLGVHPEGMIVYSVPEQEFTPLVVQLLGCEEKLRIAVCGSSSLAPTAAPEDRAYRDPADSPRSQLRSHQLDLSSEDADDEKTG